MKTLLVFALILFNCLLGFSQQEFAPIGAEWYYSFNEGMQNEGAGYYLLKSIKDTTIDSKECKVLSHTLVNSKRISTYLGQSIVYHDTKENKIYRYLYANFYLLYDFTKVVGDTIVIKEPYSASRYDSIVMVVDSVGIVTYPGNIQLKSLDVRQVRASTYGFGGKIIEKLGNIDFLFPVNQLWCDSGCPGFLRCYNDDKINLSLYQLPCDAVYSNTNIVNTVEVSVYPNPVSGELFVQPSSNIDEGFTLEMYSIKGELVKTECLEPGSTLHRIDTSSLRNGVYILRLISDSGKYDEKVIVKE